LLLFNADAEACDFVLPSRRFGTSWALELATATSSADLHVPQRGTLSVSPHSLAVLKRES